MNSSLIEVRLENGAPLLFTLETKNINYQSRFSSRSDDMLVLSILYWLTLPEPPMSGTIVMGGYDTTWRLLDTLRNPDKRVYITGISGYIQFGQHDCMRYPLYLETFPVPLDRNAFLQMNVAISFPVFEQHVHEMRDDRLFAQHSTVIFQLLVVEKATQKVEQFFSVTGELSWEMTKPEYYAAIQNLRKGMMDITYISLYPTGATWLDRASAWVLTFGFTTYIFVLYSMINPTPMMYCFSLDTHTSSVWDK